MGRKSRIKQQRYAARTVNHTINTAFADAELLSDLAADRLNRLYPPRIVGINWSEIEFQEDTVELEIMGKRRMNAYAAIIPTQKTDEDSAVWTTSFRVNPLSWVLMKEELDAIVERAEKDWKVMDYQHGRAQLFQSLLSCVTNGEPDKTGVIEAGRILHGSGGIKDMRDALGVWTPQACHRMVDTIWNGIGDWRG